jgi:hypothetical protein
MNPSEAFERVFHGNKNFMTPNRYMVGKKGKFFYEISYGNRMFGTGYMYGVTVLEHTDGELTQRHDLSELFYDLDSAKKHAKNLK